MDLDHVALGTRDAAGVLRALVEELGAELFEGWENVGFRGAQVRVGAEGMVVEVIEPWLVSQNDFLERFLARRGDGPHHMTFKTPDISATLDRLRAAGFEPVNVDLSQPWWKEAFLMPAQAGGTVVQIAESNPETVPDDIRRTWNLRWWGEDPEPGSRRATLRRVVVNTPSLGDALGLFRDLLGGVAEPRGETPDAPSGAIELRWPGGGRVLFEERPEAAGGMDRLECEHPGGPGEAVIGGARFVLNPAGE